MSKQIERRVFEINKSDLEERLREVINDLEIIDKAIPTESSRCGCLVGDKEAAAIIEERKKFLLRYIQTICRDNVLWCRKLLGDKAK